MIDLELRRRLRRIDAELHGRPVFHGDDPFLDSCARCGKHVNWHFGGGLYCHGIESAATFIPQFVAGWRRFFG